MIGDSSHRLRLCVFLLQGIQVGLELCQGLGSDSFDLCQLLNDW